MLVLFNRAVTGTYAPSGVRENLKVEKRTLLSLFSTVLRIRACFER